MLYMHHDIYILLKAAIRLFEFSDNLFTSPFIAVNFYVLRDASFKLAKGNSVHYTLFL